MKAHCKKDYFLFGDVIFAKEKTYDIDEKLSNLSDGLFYVKSKKKSFPFWLQNHITEDEINKRISWRIVFDNLKVIKNFKSPNKKILKDKIIEDIKNNEIYFEDHFYTAQEIRLLKLKNLKLI
jgi:hypothetical protein